jgi:nucleotide-binding universal stress UspA family protein
VAEERDVNAILIGSHPDSAGDGLTLGTTAERLCRKASKPVWIVRGGKAFRGRSIVCPVDFSGASRRAMRNAIHLARKMQASLAVLHVAEPPSSLSSFLSRDSSLESRYVADRQAKFDEFLGEFDFAGVNFEQTLRVGSASDQILSFCAEMESDLVVMGTVGQSGLARILLGSVAADVARRSSCSVVMLKAEDAIRLKLEEEIGDVATSFAEASELLEQGFLEDARRRLEHCVSANDVFIPAWQALAEVHNRLGDKKRAAECQETARRVEDLMYWKKVEADVRSQHIMWKKGRSS